MQMSFYLDAGRRAASVRYGKKLEEEKKKGTLEGVFIGTLKSSVEAVSNLSFVLTGSRNVSGYC